MRSVRSMLRALLLGLFVVLFWFLLPNLLYLGGALLFPDRAEGLLSFLNFFGTALSALFLMGIFAAASPAGIPVKRLCPAVPKRL